ncbi:MAG: response regulator [Bacteroidota bacterium]
MSNKRPLIIMLDDDQTVLDCLTNQLRSRFQSAFTYETTTSMTEAWEVIEEAVADQRPIHLIISDWNMPLQNGDQFLIDVQRKYPGIPQLMLSGYADEESVERARQGANLVDYIAKPWDEEDIYRIVEGVTAPFQPA